MNMNLGWSTHKVKSDSGDDDNSDPVKEFSLNLTPRAGYFVINNLAVGLDFTLAYNRMKRTSGGEYISNSTRFGAGPFLRYYIPTQKFLPFAEYPGYKAAQRVPAILNRSVFRQNCCI